MTSIGKKIIDQAVVFGDNAFGASVGLNFAFHIGDQDSSDGSGSEGSDSGDGSGDGT